MNSASSESSAWHAGWSCMRLDCLEDRSDACNAATSMRTNPTLDRRPEQLTPHRRNCQLEFPPGANSHQCASQSKVAGENSCILPYILFSNTSSEAPLSNCPAHPMTS